MKYLLILPAFFLLLSFSNDERKASIERGKGVYEEYCMVCHMATGQGVEGAFPPLAQSDFLLADVERAINIVQEGQSGAIVVNGVTYNNYMPSPGLDDEEIVDVMNYILNSWGNEAQEMVTLEQVQE